MIGCNNCRYKFYSRYEDPCLPCIDERESGGERFSRWDDDMSSVSGTTFIVDEDKLKSE